MTFEVAVMGPSLDALVAPEFDSAPFFVFVDLITRRSSVFPNPVQYNAICSVMWLVRQACLPKPDVVLAGHFSPEDQRLMREIGQRFSAVTGCARNRIESWGHSPQARRDRLNVGLTRAEPTENRFVPFCTVPEHLSSKAQGGAICPESKRGTAGGVARVSARRL